MGQTQTDRRIRAGRWLAMAGGIPRVVALVAAAAAGLSAAAAETAVPVILAQEAKAAPSVLAVDATPAEKSAAAELATHLSFL